jgi:hypothetical protein
MMETRIALYPSGKNEPKRELLRRREIQRWLPFSDEEIQSLVGLGELEQVRQHRRAKAYYRKRQIIMMCGMMMSASGSEPSSPLLRQRQILNWSGMTADELGLWVVHGHIEPLRKHRTAKAYYRKHEIKRLIYGLYERVPGALPPVDNQEPTKLFLRRNDVLVWLNISRAELDSFVAARLISVIRIRPNSKAYYSKPEIKSKILKVP